MQTFYTSKQINELRTAAQFYKLDAPKEFWNKTATELKRCCNGAGAECWRDSKRYALTSALKLYEAPIMVHDVDYEYQSVTKQQADKRLKDNMLKVWRKHYGFWRWFKRSARVERIIVIPAVYAAVVLGGDSAWKETKSKRQ